MNRIASDKQGAIRELIRGAAPGTHPMVLARQIQHLVDLDRDQLQAVSDYRATLLDRSRPAGQVDRMVARFELRKLKERAGLIAHTEIMIILGERCRLGWEHQVRSGALDPNEWEQEWVSSHDISGCDSCELIDGSRVQIGAPFSTPFGEVLNPPAHSSCRCTVRLVPLGFRKGEPTTPARDRILASLGVLHPKRRA